MSEPKYSGSHVPFNAEKAEAWNRQWQRRYAPSHESFVVPHHKRVRVLNFEHPSCQVVLDLEVQINGRVLSVPKEK